MLCVFCFIPIKSTEEEEEEKNLIKIYLKRKETNKEKGEKLTKSSPLDVYKKKIEHFSFFFKD